MNKLFTPTLPGTQIDPRHPDEDGRFMGETDYHTKALIWLRQALEDFFVGRQDVYVGSNLIYYWQEGDAGKRRDPDGLVAKGVRGSHPRRAYRLWEEKVKPCAFFEIASRRTWRVDLNVKPGLYASLGVKEYFLFDPEGGYLDPVLQGFRSVKGLARPLKPAADGSLVSKQLGLRLVPEGDLLRLYDLATGQPILTRDEQAAREHERAAQEAERAAQEAERAERERQRAEKEKQLREQEQQQARALAAEVERLRRLLDERRS